MYAGAATDTCTKEMLTNLIAVHIYPQSTAVQPLLSHLDGKDKQRYPRGIMQIFVYLML